VSWEDVDPTAELRALAHPVRLRILSLLTGAPLTAADVARELGITHANASYHLRHLLASHLIELDAEERIRGGAAKRYRIDVERQLERPRRPPDDRRPTPGHLLVYAALAAELRRRAQLMRRTTRQYLADAELWVEPETWTELCERMASAADDLHRAARPAHTPGTARVSVTLALFEMEP
jgi:DNA-binding transcriptional ArsR family regulator